MNFLLVECPDKCKPGCFCKPGYLRNHRQKCVSDGSKIKTRLVQKLTDRYEGVFKCQRASRAKIRPRSGGPVKCGQNQVDKKCGSKCGESCDVLGKDFVCPLRKICIRFVAELSLPKSPME